VSGTSKAPRIVWLAHKADKMARKMLLFILADRPGGHLGVQAKRREGMEMADL